MNPQTFRTIGAIVTLAYLLYRAVFIIFGGRSWR